MEEELPDLEYDIEQRYIVTDNVTDVKTAHIKVYMHYETPTERVITFPDGKEIKYTEDTDLGKLSHFEMEQILLYRHGYLKTLITKLDTIEKHVNDGFDAITSKL